MSLPKVKMNSRILPIITPSLSQSSPRNYYIICKNYSFFSFSILLHQPYILLVHSRYINYTRFMLYLWWFSVDILWLILLKSTWLHDSVRLILYTVFGLHFDKILTALHPKFLFCYVCFWNFLNIAVLVVSRTRK